MKVTNVTTLTYGSVASLIETSVSGWTTLRDADRNSRESKPDTSWDAGAGFDGSVTLATSGWAAGAEVARNLAYKFTKRVRESHAEYAQPAFAASVVGSGVNVARHIAGRPDSMVRRLPVVMDRPVVHIVMSSAASGGIGGDAITARGAAVTALIDLLELSGRRVRLTVVNTSSKNDTGLEIRVTAKRPEDRMQTDAIAFVTAHPAFLRRIIFGVMETAAPAVRRAIGIGGSNGYGSPTPVQGDQGDVYVKEMSWSQGWSDDNVNTWIEDVLREQGVLAD